jgi:hypothetical protein
MSIFSSGSCRVLGSTNLAPMRAIHAGDINCIGWLHNTKQHIQFLKYLRKELTIPNHILPLFLSNYNNKMCNFGAPVIKQRELEVRTSLEHCNTYIFEICSIKIFEKDGYQLQTNLLNKSTTSDYRTYIQSETDLNDDLQTLRNMIPKEKKIIFQCHFRLNIIFNNPALEIKNRELINKVLTEFCKNKENTYLNDPSIIMSKDITLLGHDNNHFSAKGHVCNIEEIRKFIRL